MRIQLLKKKGGFTLIELMIVVFIIGLISSISVLSYTTYRRAVLLDFAADTFVAQINEIRGKTIVGDFGSGGGDKVRAALSNDSSVEDASTDAKCFGLLFKNSGGKFDTFVISQKFDGRKQWIPIDKNWEYVGCGQGLPQNDGANYLSEDVLEMDEDVVLSNVFTVSNSTRNKVIGASVLRFLPPDGRLVSLDYKNIDKLLFIFSYGSGENAKTKTVEYDLISLNARVLDEKTD